MCVVLPCGALDGHEPRFQTLALVGNETGHMGCDTGTGRGGCAGRGTEAKLPCASLTIFEFVVVFGTVRIREAP
jgi:ribosomal protein S5